MSKLKPCPFCGAKENFLDFAFIGKTRFTNSYMFVECKMCGAMMVDLNMSHTLNDVIEAWNRRVEDDKTGTVKEEC